MYKDNNGHNQTFKQERSDQQENMQKFCLKFFDEESDKEDFDLSNKTENLINFIKQNTNICDTPLSQILTIAQSHPQFRSCDWNELKKLILKQKYHLKRIRAKNRFKLREEENHNLKFVEMEEDLKKKRNRISAQISRDKNKERIKDLQTLTLKLQKECQQRKLQNQKLKCREVQNKNSHYMKMMIFFGFLFFMGVLKDTINPSQFLVKKINQNSKMEYELIDQYLSIQASEKMNVRFIQEPLVDIIPDEIVRKQVKDKIQDNFEQAIRLEDLNISQELKKNIEKMKKWALDQQ